MTSPTSRQLLTSLGSCYDRLAHFTIYCCDWWGHSPFSTLICSMPESPLAQPVQAPAIKPQLLCSYSQLQEINRTKHWAVAYLMSFGVLFFLFVCMCVAATVHRIIQGHSTEAAKQKWSNKQFLPPSLGPCWCDYSEWKARDFAKCESLSKSDPHEKNGKM